MRILLIYPSWLGRQGQVLKYRKAVKPPLSLAVLDALTPGKHDVRVVNDIVEEIDFSDRYDLVAITAMTIQIARAYQIADAFRRRNIPVVIGGMHATALPEEAQQHADAVVIGEAENVWSEVLVDCERKSLKPYYRDPTHPDLSKLVIPRWDHMNMRVYLKPPGFALPQMPIFATRGCPLGCKFCAVTKFFGKTYRTKPVAHVLKELDAVNSKDFFFVDDNIAFNPDYAHELFRALATRKRIHWLGQISTQVLRTPEVIELAAKAGCADLFIGVESLNAASLAGVNKRFNNEDQCEELIKRLKHAGIVPYLSFIFGFDEDTPDQFDVILRFLRRNRVGFAFFWLLTPFPGTDLFASMQSQGRLLTADWSLYDAAHLLFETKNFGKAEFVDRFWHAYRRMYTLPNMFRSACYNAAFSQNPLREFLSSVWNLLHSRMKVRSRESAFSGGIGLINREP
jgi:radical SAM superfamily enzyme YgiQ (UPF0313 family)